MYPQGLRSPGGDSNRQGRSIRQRQDVDLYQGPIHTPQQAQGIGRIYFEQNAPKFGPKHPGVGFWHALTRWAQKSARGPFEVIVNEKK